MKTTEWIKQAILDSTKGNKQSQKLLQKANLCYIYLTQTALMLHILDTDGMDSL